MTFTLKGPVPGFYKELADVVRIFFPEARELDQGGELEIFITESEEGQARHSRATLRGALEGSHGTTDKKQADPILEKRLHKRQQKLAVYFALKAATGLIPPWGSLTGIRPARLVYAQMAQGLGVDQAAEQVRDIFDLSAEKAGLLADVVRTQQSLTQPGEQDIGIYIGIPFCQTRCRYCSFISCQVGDGKLLPGYVRALVAETEAVARMVADQGFAVRSVYVGGGTPTALPPDMLGLVLTAAGSLMRQSREITVEAGRPDSITPEKLRVIADHGATRISINPQTMHDKTLEAIGRRHSRAQTEAAYALAREMGFHNINMDLIAGLPGEDLTMFEATLAWARGISPESLTVHTLSLKRSSDMHRFGESTPREAAVDAMVRKAREMAHDMGMAPYYLYRQKHMAGNLENVGYARPGHACLYNMDMMEDTGSVLALGAGGISKRVYDNGARILRAPNVKDPEHYIARVDEMIKRKVDLLRGVGSGVRRPGERGSREVSLDAESTD